MNNKKAQVTLFIVIGVVLLLSTTIYFGVKGKLTFFDPDSVIAPDKVAVKNFVEACLDKTSKDAVALVSFQGGYAKGLVEKNSWKSRGGEYQEFLGGTGSKSFKIPYWSNNGIDFVPTRADVEENLAWYIDQRLDQCLQNFTSVKEFYDLNVESEPKSKVTIGQGKISVDLDYKLIIKTLKDSGTTEINNFHSSVNTNLYDALTLAQLIYADDYINDRFWNLTMEMIAGSDLPYKGIELDCHDKLWTMSELEEKFNNYVRANFNYITYENTKNDLVFKQDYPPYYQNRYSFDIGAEGMHQKFLVTTQAMKTTDFSIFPNQGGLTVKSMDIDLPLVGSLIDPCINIYNHFYSADYPIKVTIRDDAGMKFNFIVPVNILYNKRKTSFERSFEDLVFYKENITVTNDDYCNDANNNVTVIVKNKITNDAIPNATLNYNCVSFGCKVGTTDYMKDQYGSVLDSVFPRFYGGFPSCNNGELIVRAKDYKDGSIHFTPVEQEDALIVYLDPIVRLNASFEFMESMGGYYQPRTVDDYKNVTILAYTTNNDNGELGYTVFGAGDNSFKIPLNHSGDNNLTFSVRVLDTTKNLSIGGYEYTGMFDAENIASHTRVIFPVIVKDINTDEEMSSLFTNEILTTKLEPRFT